MALNQDSDVVLWRRWLGESRADSYLAVAPGMPISEIATWNQRLAASLMADISHVELALRNCLSQALQQRLQRGGVSQHWLRDPTGELVNLGGHVLASRLEDARARALQAKPNASFDDEISELTLGFWTALLSSAFQPLQPDIVGAFTGLENRNIRVLPKQAAYFRRLRNRVSHHHRVIHRDLLFDWNQILRFGGLIDPALRGYLKRESETPGLVIQFQSELDTNSKDFF